MRGDIIDTDGDPFARAAARRRRLARLFFPFLFALLLVAAIVAITIHTERVNRHDALALTGAVIAAVENSVRRELEAYLAPPAAAVAALADAAAERGVSGRPGVDGDLERAMYRIMLRAPELASVYVGDAEGDFLMVQRRDGNLMTKFVGASGGPREVRWIDRGGRRADDTTWLDPTDDFDPASRPWFDAAFAGEGPAWSDVYRFFTTGELGVTVSVAAPRVAGVPPTVAGADVEIAELGRFLGTLDLGAGGRAVILDPAGDVVAFPPSLQPTTTERAPRIEDFDLPLLAKAYARFRIDRNLGGSITIDGGDYFVSSSSLADLVDRDWWLLIVAPERDFVGFVSENARRSLLLSGVVVVLATSVAGLLTYQGIQSDARAARAERAQAAVAAQGQTLDALAEIAHLDDPEDPESLRRFAAVAAEAVGARRVGIWRFDDPSSALICLETFDREVRGHTAAATLHADHLGAAWPALAAARRLTVTAADEDAADEDDAFARLRELYMAGTGTARLDILPVVRDGRLLGHLWLEDVDPTAGVVVGASLEGLLASLLAPRLERLQRTTMERREPGGRAGTALPAPAPGAATPVAPGLTTVDLAVDRRLLREIHEQGGLEQLGATLLPRLAVLSLVFDDATALAAPAPHAPGSRIAALVDAAMAAAEEVGVRWLRLDGDRLVAADGFAADADDPAPARRVADLALALQPSCRELSRARGGRTAYRLGLAVGPAFGVELAALPARVVLWGHAFRLAARMAETAPASAIQLTEAAYGRLGVDYLLRRRGSYFIDGVGETSTYLLAGRL